MFETILIDKNDHKDAEAQFREIAEGMEVQKVSFFFV